MPFENLMMKMAREKARKEGLQEGREEGREQGREEGRRAVVHKLLQLRFGPLPQHAEQFLAQAQPAELTALEDKILLAASLGELIQPKH